MDPTLKIILKPIMEVVPKFSFETQEVVLSSPAASKCTTVEPIELDYTIIAMMPIFRSPLMWILVHIYQLSLEDLSISEILTGQMVATSNTLEYLYVEFFGVHTTEHNGQLVGMGFDFVTLL